MRTHEFYELLLSRILKLALLHEAIVMSFSRRVTSLVVIVSLCVVKFAKPQQGPTTDAVGGQDGVTVDTNQP